MFPPIRHHTNLIDVLRDAVLVERVDKVGSGQEFVGFAHEGRLPVHFGHSHVDVENTRHVQFDQMKILTDLA